MLLLSLGCALITKDQYDERINGGETEGDCASEDVVTWYEDLDGDGFGDDDSTEEACEKPEGYVDVGGDCNDDNGGMWPGADEICNGASDDCDELIDEEPIDGNGFQPDLDRDGFTVHGEQQFFCPGSQPEDWFGPSGEPSDCDDSDPTVFPGADEYCNQIDDDCDDGVDEKPVDGDQFFEDVDGDDYGNPEAPVVACEIEGGALVENDLDCDDSDAEVNPDQEEVEGDGIDNDCDGGGTRIKAVVGVGTKHDAAIYGESWRGIGTGYANLGDVDGDGDDELLVAAANACECPTDGGSSGAYYPGEVWFLAGGFSGGISAIEDVARGHAELRTEENAWLGVSLGGGTDLLGNGASSAWLGASLHGDGGEVFVMDAIELADEVDPSELGETLEGAITGANFGFAGAQGDFDGDGQPDLAMSAPGANHNGVASGAVYVYLGPVAGGESTDADGRYVGRPNTQTGYALGAGDFDADGIDDLAIGSPYDDGDGVDAGAIFLVQGPTTAYKLAESGLPLNGEANNDHFGLALSVGDADGDGRDDVLASAPYVTLGAVRSGAAYLILDPMSGEMNVGDADALFDGTSVNGNLGTDVEFVGDLDHDGKADLAIGAPGAAASAGTVLYYYGSPEGTVDSTDADFAMIGQSAGDALYTASPIGDYLSSGADVFAVGTSARTYDSRPSAGMVYFFEHPEL